MTDINKRVSLIFFLVDYRPPLFGLITARNHCLINTAFHLGGVTKYFSLVKNEEVKFRAFLTEYWYSAMATKLNVESFD